MEVERVVVKDVDGEKHENEMEIIRQRNRVGFLSPVHLIDEALQRDHHELRKEIIRC